MKCTAGYNLLDLRNEDILKELTVDPAEKKLALLTYWKMTWMMLKRLPDR
jgi:hypothetical protein